MSIRAKGRHLLTFLNKILPKKERIIVIGFPNTESGAIEVANHLHCHRDLPVFYVISKETDDNPKNLLLPGINIVERTSRLDLQYLSLVMTSRYIFFTHGIFLNDFSPKQTVVNLWHGILYKKVGRLTGKPAMFADHTVGTSTLTRKMFSEAFGVLEETVTSTGYPRNDALLQAADNKDCLLEKLGIHTSTYDKILIWLPTYRTSVIGDIREDGTEIGNPFYIPHFEVSKFNRILRKYNVLCIVKPHPMAPVYDNLKNLSNLLFINDTWISQKGISLYQLLGCTDLLISDVSSVVIDYLLTDKPILCISTDLEAYKNSRGFYFDDIRAWLPGVVENQQDFFKSLDLLLSGKEDPYAQKREDLKKKFFRHHDAHSTGRLVDTVFGRNATPPQ